jgi:hypothetical protein
VAGIVTIAMPNNAIFIKDSGNIGVPFVKIKKMIHAAR